MAGGSDWVRFPGQSGSNWGSGGWRHPWHHAQKARVSTPACERTPAATPAACERVTRSSCACCRRQPPSDLLAARAWVFGPEIFRFCRSWADWSSCGTSFVKFFSDLRRLEWETRGSMGICGHAWWLRCWRSFWVLYIKVLTRFLWVDFFVKSCQKF